MLNIAVVYAADAEVGSLKAKEHVLGEEMKSLAEEVARLKASCKMCQVSLWFHLAYACLALHMPGKV